MSYAGNFEFPNPGDGSKRDSHDDWASSLESLNLFVDFPEDSLPITEISRPTADFQQRSRPTAGFQRRSRPTAEFQRRSRPIAEFQRKSRSAPYVQEKSRSADPEDDFQQKRWEINSSGDLQSDKDDCQKWYPSSQKSSAAISPWIGENELLFHLGKRLSDEQIYAFFTNIKELQDGKQTVEETSRKLDDIFGKDMILSFEGWLISGKHRLSGRINSLIDRTEFLLQAKSCLSDEQLQAFLSAMAELNAKQTTEENTLSKLKEIFGTGNRNLFLSFQGLFLQNQNLSAANPPLREHSNGEELTPPDEDSDVDSFK